MSESTGIKKTGKVREALTADEVKILAKVVVDPFYFSEFINVIHPKRGKVPFKLYPYQQKVLWSFLNNRFNMILKFRQAGITELISMYCLWLAMYHDYKAIQIISIKERVAKKVLKKIKYMYRHLPDFMKVQVINGKGAEIGTQTELEFINGSLITSVPTTEDAGRSEALSLLVIDEAAIVKWANTIWAASFPTLSTGGAAILNSTPYGVGNFFHKMWVNACAGGNDFVPIRLRWQMHPERDEKWYKEQRAALGPRKTAQEIDGDFLTSGASVFDLADIKAIEDTLSEHRPVETHMNGQLKVYKLPQPGIKYFMGADVASGRARDYSSFSIMDKKGEEMVSFKGKLHPTKFAELLYKWGKRYNWALAAPEGNDIGLATVAKLQDMNYRNLYYFVMLVKEKGEKKPKEQKIPGWLTTSKNRRVIIEELSEDLSNDNVIIKDQAFCDEAYTFIYDESNRPVAMGKDSKGSSTDSEVEEDDSYTDDDIMAKAITNHIRKGQIKTTPILPR